MFISISLKNITLVKPLFYYLNLLIKVKRNIGMPLFQKRKAKGPVLVTDQKLAELHRTSMSQPEIVK